MSVFDIYRHRQQANLPFTEEFDLILGTQYKPYSELCIIVKHGAMTRSSEIVLVRAEPNRNFQPSSYFK